MSNLRKFKSQRAVDKGAVSRNNVMIAAWTLLLLSIVPLFVLGFHIALWVLGLLLHGSTTSQDDETAKGMTKLFVWVATVPLLIIVVPLCFYVGLSLRKLRAKQLRTARIALVSGVAVVSLCLVAWLI